MIERIAKLIALAENAGSEAEAAAAFEMAQRLASKWQIDLAVARLHAAPKEREKPITRTVRIGEKGKHANANLIELFTTIGRANDVHCLIAHNSTFVQASGMPSDLDTVEALWSALAADMSRWADKLVRDKNADWRKETVYVPARSYYDDGEYKPVTAQSARKSFSRGYIYRIGERLQEARKTSIQEADLAREEERATMGELDVSNLPSSMSLVLKDKSAEVEAHQWAEYERRYGKRRAGSWRGGSSTARYSSSANSAGRAAADRASLSGRRAVGA